MPSSANIIALSWGITSAVFICWLVSKALASSNRRTTFWTCIVAAAQVASLLGIAVLRDRVLVVVGRDQRDTFISYYAVGLVVITIAFFVGRARRTRGQ